MGIYKVANDLKGVAMSMPTVAMASFGDISLYDNKSTIFYPYVNIDVVTDDVAGNGVGTYRLRIYVADRNEPFVAYNKCELILDNFMRTIEVQNYQINYFTLEFQDVVNGVYADIEYDESFNLNCNGNI